MIILAAIIGVAVLLFWAILQLDVPGLWKFGLVFAEMVMVSQIFIKRYKMPSELGLVLIKSKKGIKIIDDLSRFRTFNFLSDVGNTIVYGLMSLILTRKHSSAASVVIGIILLGFLSFFVAPTAFVFLIKMLEIGSADESASSIVGKLGEAALPAVAGILLLGGLFLFILTGIVFYGGVVLMRILDWLVYGAREIWQTEPGGTFLLPGVNLPFFEGIIALVVVMIAHEGAHAVLARIGKIPILSSGIVLFGIIPVGAFVEPDEKKLAKLDSVRQTRVIVAGPTSNLITSCIFFVIFLLFAVAINALGLAGNPAMVFIYTTLGLTFALNFIVGAVNLLPLPLFDGYRIVEINVKNKYIVKAVMYVTLIFFILNFLPWFFRFFEV